MKQNQKGVSVIVLVISIIVIIVLLLIAFGSSWKPIGSIAKVGDYVNYSANGVTSWRVFDIRNGEVLITPADGPVGTVKINGVDGYVTALTEIEKKCDEYENVSLGITESDVRSMTIDDINKIAGYIPETSTMEKYAYFLDSDITYDTAVLEYDGYTKTKHTSEFFTRFNSNWTTPRFYTWDYADSENITEDENGISYAYPTEGKPVYVTKTSSRYDINSYKHVNDNSITVSSLLGSNSFWLASLGVVTEPSIALFTVRMVDYDVTSRLLATSYGATFEHSEGVRPLVSLGFDIQAKGKGTLSSPFKLSLISEQN